jgi:hypothetical protein
MRPGWLIAVGIVGLVGTVQTLWQLLPSGITDEYDLVIPHLTWQEWALAVSVILMCGMFEGSFRYSRRLRAEIEKQRSAAESYWAAHNAKTGDIPVEHVFYWIDIGILDDSKWEIVGADLIDKLHLGQLKAWGRRVSPHGHVGPLTEINKLMWEKMRFNYQFFYDVSPSRPQTWSPNEGSSEFAGIVFNADQIAAFWPAPVPL